MADLSSSFPATRSKKPIDKARESIAQSRRCIVSKQFSRLRNVRASQWYVAELLRKPIDFCFSAKRILDRRDQIFKLNGLALPEIKYIKKRSLVLERSHCSSNYILDISVITARRPVAKLIDRLIGINALGELMNRQIGPLPRAVNSEISQRDNAHPVKMRVSRAKKFARDLRCRVW